MIGEARGGFERKRERELEGECVELCESCRDPAQPEKRRRSPPLLNCVSGRAGRDGLGELCCLPHSYSSSSMGSREGRALVEVESEEEKEECSRSRGVEEEDETYSETDSRWRLECNCHSSVRERTPSRGGQTGVESEAMEEATAVSRISGQNPWRRSTSGRVTRTRPSPIPPEAEMEEFFAKAEAAERSRFAEKYNFDVAKEIPLEGRYEWVRLKR